MIRFHFVRQLIFTNFVLFLVTHDALLFMVDCNMHRFTMLDVMCQMINSHDIVDDESAVTCVQWCH
jgi:hypothetical protein